MRHPFQVGDIVETKKHRDRALVVDTDTIHRHHTIDIVWFENGKDAILCETQWFNLISRAEG